MTLPITRILFALSFVAASVVCWTAAGTAEDLADRHERIATLRGSEWPATGRTRQLVERIVGATLGKAPTPSQSRFASDYWSGRYDTIASSSAAESGDPDLLLMAANASFRKTQREANGRPLSVEQLDLATQAYANVLKNGGFNSDAAFNFEYVARVRDSVARSKGASVRPPPAQRPADDLPSGPTIHGRPGTHPPGTRGEEFEILTPMDYGEREAQPEATPGKPLPRKG